MRYVLNEYLNLRLRKLLYLQMNVTAHLHCSLDCRLDLQGRGFV